MTNAHIEAYYQKNLTTHGAGAEGVGWKNAEAQLVRFDQLLKVIYTTGEVSVNDVGCGVGDLSEYLSTTGYQAIYRGYDVLTTMIEEAKRKYTTGPKRQFFRTQDLKQMECADYSLASGIFNLKFEVSEESLRKYILYK
ncbi:MAG: methyltransferase domain-containing protein, partial [Flammeovirgaceae bacterium]